MKNLIKFIVWLLGLAVFLLLTAHFTLRHALNTPKFKAAVTGYVERLTGRTLTYERIEYHLFPFSVDILDAVLKEADGTTDFISIPEFSAVINLWHKDLESFQLNAPSVRIVQHADGSFNFSDLIQPDKAEEAGAGGKPAPPEPAGQTAEVPAREATPAEATRPADGAAIPFSIGLIHVEQAKLDFIRMEQDGSETPFTLTDLEFSVKDFAPDRPFQMEGRVKIGDASGLMFTLSGPAPATAIEKPGEWPAAFTSELRIGDFADLQAFLPEGTLPFQRLEVRLSANGTLADGLQIQGHLETPTATEAYPVGLNMDLNSRLSLPKAVLKHVLSGEPLPEDMAVDLPACDPPEGTIFLAGKPLDALLIKYLAGDASLTFPRIAYGMNQFDDGTITLQMTDGKLTLTRCDLKAYGGTLEAQGEVRLLACPLSYQLDPLTARKLDIAEAVAANDIQMLDSFSGQIEFDAQANGSAVSEKTLDRLTMQASLQIKDLQSVGPGGSLEDRIWAKLDNPLLLEWVPRIQDQVTEAKAATAQVTTSRYEQATISLAFDRGTATLSNTRLAAPRFSITLAGRILPLQNELDMEARFVLSENETMKLTDGKDRSDVLPYENGGLMIPLTLKGALDSPTVRPDFDLLLKKAARGTARKEIGRQLDKLHSKDKKNIEQGLQLLQNLLE